MLTTHLSAVIEDAQYQRKMLGALRDVKGSHSVVGYYHAVSLGQLYKNAVVDSLVNGVDKIRHGGVVVVHGESETSQTPWLAK